MKKPVKCPECKHLEKGGVTYFSFETDKKGEHIVCYVDKLKNFVVEKHFWLVPMKRWDYDPICDIPFAAVELLLMKLQNKNLPPFRKVFAFHKKFNMHIGNGEIDKEEIKLGFKLIVEEYEEFIDAYFDKNWVETVDAIVDMIFVLYGMLVRMGVDGDYLFDVVWKANMKKEGGAKRKDGKLVKPDGWVPPQEKIRKHLIERGVLK